jgi:hypothetical protein
MSSRSRALRWRSASAFQCSTCASSASLVYGLTNAAPPSRLRRGRGGGWRLRFRGRRLGCTRATVAALRPESQTCRTHEQCYPGRNQDGAWLGGHHGLPYQNERSDHDQGYVSKNDGPSLALVFHPCPTFPGSQLISGCGAQGSFTRMASILVSRADTWL